MNRKVLVITAFYNYDYEIRVKYLEKVLKDRECDYLIMSTNFDHRNKKKYFVDRELVIQVDVPEYKSNLSFNRIRSHYIFSKDIENVCSEYNPDVIYAITPPNFMFYYLRKYKAQHNVYVICEIEDLWPESLPLSAKTKSMLKPMLKIWGGLRTHNMNFADYLIYECDLFKDYLKKYVDVPGKTVYLSKDDTYLNESLIKFEETLKFVYLGSVNNLIDIDLIITILNISSESHNTELNIIGGGEKINTLVDRCKESNIEVINHGVIYKDKEKNDIFKQCHLALNIMKPTVYVGATMKSLEYFHYGMPMINNIQGDTTKIVETYNCGINLTNTEGDVELIREFTSKVDNNMLQRLSMASRQVYKKFFSPKSFEVSIGKIFDNVR